LEITVCVQDIVTLGGEFLEVRIVEEEPIDLGAATKALCFKLFSGVNHVHAGKPRAATCASSRTLPSDATTTSELANHVMRLKRGEKN